MLTIEKVKELQAVDADGLEFFDAPCGPTDWKEILVTLEATLLVVEAAKSLTIARYGIGIPLTKDPDVLGESFDKIQAMFKPLEESLKPFSPQPTGGRK